jgi:glycosyltransferase involved in cell wall biosynthesis
LKNKGINSFKVIFTLDGSENEHISKLYWKVKSNQLPIEFVGTLNREQVFEMYTKAILLFPSYVETYGLPLLESRMHQGIIVASDCSFSHEILDGYPNAYFFNPFDSESLSILMEKIIKGKIPYKKIMNDGLRRDNYQQNRKIVDIILETILK